MYEFKLGRALYWLFAVLAVIALTIASQPM